MEHSPLVSSYLRYAGASIRPSREDEVVLVERARRHEPGAVDDLLRQHVAFVIRVAMEFRGRGVPLDDLVNEGCVGILRAIGRFDASNGARFMTYASFWIRKAMLDALAEQPRVVRIPRYQRSKGATIPREVRLDEPLAAADGRTYADELADPSTVEASARLIDDETSAQLRGLLATLPARERTVLSSRFGLDGRGSKTLLEVGERLEISRERVRQIETAALERLRRSLVRAQASAALRLAPSQRYRTRPMNPAIDRSCDNVS